MSNASSRRGVRIFAALSIGLLAAHFGDAKPLIAAEQSPITAIDFCWSRMPRCFAKLKPTTPDCSRFSRKGLLSTRRTARTSRSFSVSFARTTSTACTQPPARFSLEQT